MDQHVSELKRRIQAILDEQATRPESLLTPTDNLTKSAKDCRDRITNLIGDAIRVEGVDDVSH